MNQLINLVLSVIISFVIVLLLIFSDLFSLDSYIAVGRYLIDLTNWGVNIFYLDFSGYTILVSFTLFILLVIISFSIFNKFKIKFIK